MRKFIGSILTAVMAVSMVLPVTVSAAPSGTYEHPELTDCMSLAGYIALTDHVGSLNRASKIALRQECIASYGKDAFDLARNITQAQCDRVGYGTTADFSRFQTVPTVLTLRTVCQWWYGA